MFCINCGKQIADTARFCNYCGAKVVDFDEKTVENSPISSENPVSAPVDNVYNTENVENSVDLLKMNSSVSDSIPQMNEPVKSGETPFNGGATPPTSADIQSGAVGAQRGTADSGNPVPPMADGIAPSGTAVPPVMDSTAPSGTAVPPMMDNIAPSGSPIPPAMPTAAPAAEQTAATPCREPAERKYTLGHIIMCLASTAVMAIVAGVFAGLYFSVV